MKLSITSRGLLASVAFSIGLQMYGQIYSPVYESEDLRWSQPVAPYEEISVEACSEKACARDYDTVVVKPGNELNFKLLREYIERKQRSAMALWRAEASITEEFVQRDTLVAREVLGQVMTIRTNSEKDSIALNAAKQALWGVRSLRQFVFWSDDEEPRRRIETKMEAEFILGNLKQYLTDARAALKSLPNLRLSLGNVKHDLERAKNQLERTLDPSQREQEFRQTISSTFAILLGVFVLSFFVIIFIRGGKNVSRMLMNSNGLQFVTLFALIISIVLFGILGILKGSELAAILSGISGYILGQNRGSWAPGGNTTASTLVVPAPLVPPVTPPPPSIVGRVDPPRGMDTAVVPEVG